MTVFDVAAAGAMVSSVVGHAKAVRAWAGRAADTLPATRPATSTSASASSSRRRHR
jgi:hypothetical protein